MILFVLWREKEGSQITGPVCTDYMYRYTHTSAKPFCFVACSLICFALLTPLKLNKSQHKFNLPNFFFEDEFLKTSTNIQHKLFILPNFLR